VGDGSLSARPMARVADPLQRMGARITTESGHAPVRVDGGGLRGIRYATPVPSAQVKGAILLAGLAATGETVVVETVRTRDHTERLLTALGAPVVAGEGSVEIAAFQHAGLHGTLPGDPSSAAFLVAAAALTGGDLTVRGVGLNPSRLGFLDVMGRMGVPTEVTVGTQELGEPVGTLRVGPVDRVRPVRVEADELPLVIDEVPVLALMAAHATGRSSFLGAAELRAKESDRLAWVADTIEGLGGSATIEGDELVIGGGGLDGGTVRSGGDHRIAMAAVVGAVGARGPSRVEGVDVADVSFPGFVGALQALEARLEVET
jgi:3-phosphoshikimate 1-carboxyvinyltransferase